MSSMTHLTCASSNVLFHPGRRKPWPQSSPYFSPVSINAAFTVRKNALQLSHRRHLLNLDEVLRSAGRSSGPAWKPQKGRRARSEKRVRALLGARRKNVRAPLGARQKKVRALRSVAIASALTRRRLGARQKRVRALLGARQKKVRALRSVAI